MSQPKSFNVEFAPGRVISVDTPATGIPRYCIAKLVKQTNGTYLPVPIIWTGMARLSRNLLHKLGIPCNEHILRRLIKAGFIKGHVLSPSVTMVDIESLHQHLEATRTDGEGAGLQFWTRQKIARYREAITTLKESD